MRRIVLLGSTGSIGTQALDIARRNPGLLNIVGLAAGGSDVELLAQQALDFGVEVVALARATAAAPRLFALARSLGGSISGEHGIGRFKLAAAAELPADILRLQAAIKDVFDPAGIMNPGAKIP